jgi:hypothetical protein
MKALNVSLKNADGQALAAHREEFAATTNQPFYRIHGLPRQRELSILSLLIGRPLEGQSQPST